MYNKLMVLASPIVADPEILSGTPCFAGTRVPTKSLFDALEKGRSLEYFVEQFPSVSEEQARRVLQQAEMLIETHTPTVTRPGANDCSSETDVASTAAIEKGKSILDRVDEEGQLLVHPSAFTRAVNFRRKSPVRSRMFYHHVLDMPEISPGPDGSVDLHWRNSRSETLVNVPADTAMPISFYGDDQLGNSVNGNLVSDDNGD